MFCEKCGNKLPEGAKFCGSCGGKTEPGKPVAATAAVNPTPPPPTYTPPAQSAPQPQYHTAPATLYPWQTNSKPLGVGQYIGMFLLMCIPLVNCILLLVWSFGGNVNKNKKNYARATLIMMLIAIAISIAAGGLIAGVLSELSYSL